MNYDIQIIKVFEKQFKKLNKKYPSLKEELLRLIESLKSNPFQGTSLGKSCYKIRLAIKSKKKGKKGGARIITYVYVQQESIFLLSIYDKGKKETITDDELKLLLELLNE